MHVAIDYGRSRLELDLDAERNLGFHRGPAGLPSPAKAVRGALEAPLRFPPLRRALTPEDHVALVVDEHLPGLAKVLTPVLEHVVSAGVSAENVTLLCAEPVNPRSWIDELPDQFDDVHVVDHDPKDRKQLSYLATTRGGRRVYVNRIVVDADQVVVLTGRRFDPVLGHGGAEGALFPALGDEAARADLGSSWHVEAPGEEPWPARAEAIEVAWLLGQPFYVQLVAGAKEGIARVVAGASDAAREGLHQLETCWKVRLPRRADTVVVSVTGEPRRLTFADLAGAVASASRVVQPGGRIIVLAEGAPDLGPGMEILLRAGEPQLAQAALEKAAVPGGGPALQWARGAAHARVSLLSGLAEQTVEDLFATPLEDARQVQRLVTGGGECVVLEDGHRMMVVVE